jgi:hypothetical protein
VSLWQVRLFDALLYDILEVGKNTFAPLALCLYMPMNM